MSVEIKPYDRRLQDLFLQESERIRECLGPEVSIEHVGSSAAHIGGKNIVDILIGVRDSDEGLECGQKLLRLGYHFGNATGSDRIFMASSLDETGEGDFHVHICPKDEEEYRDFVVLRDYLIAHPDEAEKYYEMKQKIAEKVDYDRVEYKKVKGDYADGLLKMAREWGG